MSTVIDELVTILGLELVPGVKATIAGFNSALEGTTRFASWAGAALTATAASVGYFLAKTNAAAGELDRFNQITGISTDKLQSLMYAAEKSGGSAGALQDDLMGLVKSMSSPIPGEFNQGLFMLGINLHKAGGGMKSADEVLMSIADKFEGMSKMRQVQWASRIGISDDTLLLLQQGRSEIEAMFKQASEIPTIVDPKQLKAAREFTIQMTVLRRAMAYVAQTAASSAGPVLKQIVNDFMKFLKANREFIQLGLKSIVEGVVLGFRRFWDILKEVKGSMEDQFPILKRFSEQLLKTENISQLVTAALTALGVVAALIAAKFALVVGAAILAGLAIDDVITYLQGGESVTGKFIKITKDLATTFEEKYPRMTELAKTLWETMKWIATTDYSGPKKDIEDLASVLEKVVKLLGKIFEYAGKFAEWGSYKFLNFVGIADPNKGAVTMPINFPSNIGTNDKGNITIIQHITGANAPAIADEVARKTQGVFNVYPGGMAPVTQ